MSRPNTFRPGDPVVLAACGHGRVEAIEAVGIGDRPVEMYRILAADGLRVWIPTDGPAQSLRAPVSEDAVDGLLQIVRETQAPDKRTHWNRRQRRYNDLLTSNAPEQLATLLGELASVKQWKVLSFGESRLYEKAKGLLTRELRSVCGDTRIEDRLEQALAA